MIVQEVTVIGKCNGFQIVVHRRSELVALGSALKLQKTDFAILAEAAFAVRKKGR